MSNRWSELSSVEMEVLSTIFWSSGLSRTELAQLTGFSRSKANSAVSWLIDRGLIDEIGPQTSSGGRRPEALVLSGGMGVLAAIDIGATSLSVALLSPQLTVLDTYDEQIEITKGPGVILSRVQKILGELCTKLHAKPDSVIGIGIGVPGPVEFETGLLYAPPIMPGWDGFSIREYFKDYYKAPVFIDNDVNVMAIGEQWRLKKALNNFIVIKVGTGIGCGIIVRGEIYRGTDGSAGDIGHICVEKNGPLCHCGNQGCVEVMAAAPAMVRMGVESAQSGESPFLKEVREKKGFLTCEDIGFGSRSGDAASNEIVKFSGKLIGEVLAALVNFANPSHIFIGGGVSQIGPLFLASIRQSVYQRSLPLSTRHLQIQYIPSGTHAGLIGAAAMAFQEALQLYRSTHL